VAPREDLGWIKVCGLTRTQDVEAAVRAGADAVGINLWPRSPRFVAPQQAHPLVEVARGRVAVVLVCVDPTAAELAAWTADLSPDFVQIHGEPVDSLGLARTARLYYAVGVGDAGDVQRALRSPGDRVLVDARNHELRGGTGRLVPNDLARRVCRARRTVLAGGLTPENVAQSIESLHPWGVDVASGVESAPGIKDATLIERFVAASRRAWGALAEVGNV